MNGGINTPKSFDMQSFSLFALYSCQSESKKAVLICESIKQRALDLGCKLSANELDRSVTSEILKSIFDLASTRFLKSLVDIKYMQEFYKDEDYQKLFEAQSKITEQLLTEIFGSE